MSGKIRSNYSRFKNTIRNFGSSTHGPGNAGEKLNVEKEKASRRRTNASLHLKKKRSKPINLDVFEKAAESGGGDVVKRFEVPIGGYDREKTPSRTEVDLDRSTSTSSLVRTQGYLQYLIDDKSEKALKDTPFKSKKQVKATLKLVRQQIEASGAKVEKLPRASRNNNRKAQGSIGRPRIPRSPARSRFQPQTARRSRTDTSPVGTAGREPTEDKKVTDAARKHANHQIFAPVAGTDRSEQASASNDHKNPLDYKAFAKFNCPQLGTGYIENGRRVDFSVRTTLFELNKAKANFNALDSATRYEDIQYVDDLIDRLHYACNAADRRILLIRDGLLLYQNATQVRDFLRMSIKEAEQLLLDMKRNCFV